MLFIRSVKKEEAPIAFICNDFSHRERHRTEIRAYGRRLYSRRWRNLTEMERKLGKDGYLPEEIERFDIREPWGAKNKDRAGAINEWKKEARRFIIIDGEPWEECGEPMYVINTFGLGHNHGGTGLFVDHFYNPNIPNNRYFRADQGGLAVAKANEIAERRGDTKDVGSFEPYITVLKPEYIKRNPIKEHGEGDSFINSLNDLTERAGSATEAGLLAIALACRV